MGGDGGTIAAKREFIACAKSNSGGGGTSGNVDSKDAVAREKMSFCAASNAPIVFRQGEVAACELGMLYNREETLKMLLSRSANLPSHVRRLKDLITLDFEPNSKGTAMICPVTQVECNGVYPFVVLVPSGRVLSARALKEVPTLLQGGGEGGSGTRAEAEAEAGAGAGVRNERVVHLFPTAEQLEKAKLLLAEQQSRHAKAKKDKSNKKEKRKKNTTVDDEERHLSSRPEHERDDKRLRS